MISVYRADQLNRFAHPSNIWTIQILSLNVKVFIRFIIFLQTSFFFHLLADGGVKGLKTRRLGVKKFGTGRGGVTGFFWVACWGVSTRYKLWNVFEVVSLPNNSVLLICRFKDHILRFVHSVWFGKYGFSTKKIRKNFNYNCEIWITNC